MDKENNFIENITYTEIHKDDSNDLNRAGYNQLNSDNIYDIYIGKQSW